MQKTFDRIAPAGIANLQQVGEYLRRHRFAFALAELEPNRLRQFLQTRVIRLDALLQPFNLRL